MQDDAGKAEFLQGSAIATKLADDSVEAKVIFLLYQLAHQLKGEALCEATRGRAPGRKLCLAEFHWSRRWLLRALSWTDFKVFVPYGLAP